MLEALTKFFEDYTSYIVIGTSFLTCYEFFKSRSWILVVSVIAAVLFLVVVFHSPILNCLSGTTEVIGIYGHSLNSSTRGINWKKLSAILGIPLAILLVTSLFLLPWEHYRMNTLLQVVLASEAAPGTITLVVLVILGILLGIFSALMNLEDLKSSPTLPPENGEAIGGCLAGPSWAAIIIIFLLYLPDDIGKYYAPGMGGIIELIAMFLAFLIVSIALVLVAACTVAIVCWGVCNLVKLF